MTTIKLKLDQDIKIDGCDDCPFSDYLEETTYGEWTGHGTCYCKLLGLESFKEVQIYVDREECFRDDKPDTCPIIEVNHI